jgi:hypothetical protein
MAARLMGYVSASNTPTIVLDAVAVDYLVLGGGGSGGGSSASNGLAGGGGAGGMTCSVTGRVVVRQQCQPISALQNLLIMLAKLLVVVLQIQLTKLAIWATQVRFAGVLAVGGGGGGTMSTALTAYPRNGLVGGSGGGQSQSGLGLADAPAGLGSQGFAGGYSHNPGNNISGAGGGGTGAVGVNTSGDNPGAGGAGTASSVTGSSVTYGGGGGGGCHSSGTVNASGGTGGGGAGKTAAGVAAVAGTVNLGGGGGGGGDSSSTGAAGGSGVVILSFPTSRHNNYRRRFNRFNNNKRCKHNRNHHRRFRKCELGIMAHYAFIDSNNVVVKVLTGVDEQLHKTTTAHLLAVQPKRGNSSTRTNRGIQG